MATNMRRSQLGQAIVEIAIAAPVLISLLLGTFDGDGACVVAGLLRAALNVERLDPADAFAHAARDVADALAYSALNERKQTHDR